VVGPVDIPYWYRRAVATSSAAGDSLDDAPASHRIAAGVDTVPGSGACCKGARAARLRITRTRARTRGSPTVKTAVAWDAAL